MISSRENKKQQEHYMYMLCTLYGITKSYLQSHNNVSGVSNQIYVYLTKIMIQTPEEDGDTGGLHVYGRDKPGKGTKSYQ